MTLAEIKENNLRCVVKVDSKEEAVELFKIFNPNGYDADYAYDYLMGNYRKGDGTVCFSVAGNKIDGFDTETYHKKNEEQYGKIYRFKDLIANGFCDGFRGGKTPTPSKPISIEEQLGLPKGVSIHDLDMTSLYRPMNIEIQPLELVCNEEQAKEIAERLNEELARYCNAFPNNGISAKNGGKNSMKFTFYTEEGYRIDKSNNSKVETITTFVKINGFDNTYLGMATCDKVDYSEREGVINALANAMCNGNFDREFNKAVKDNARANKKARTCTYCGQLFDTRAEKEAHEAWHVERKKARRERYLLRKRAKEIAFEEQAQKLAKEMIKEDK